MQEISKLSYLIFILILSLWSNSAEAQGKRNALKKAEKNLVGSWEFVSGMAQATGGAASNDAVFAERLANNMHKSSTRTFNADGSYTRQALDLEGKTFVRKGTWQLQGNSLIMTETHSDSQPLAKENVLVWNSVTINGETLTAYLPYQQSADKAGKIEVKAIFIKE